jgi:hypothetical protein
MAVEPEFKIPVLTDEVGAKDPAEERFEKGSDPFSEPAFDPASTDLGSLVDADRDALIAELQTEIASRTFALIDELMRSAFAEMEARVFEQISGRLRAELPEIIDGLLRERFGDDEY